MKFLETYDSNLEPGQEATKDKFDFLKSLDFGNTIELKRDPDVGKVSRWQINIYISRLDELVCIRRAHRMILDNCNHQRSTKSCVFDAVEEMGRMSWDIFDTRNAVSYFKKEETTICCGLAMIRFTAEMYK